MLRKAQQAKSLKMAPGLGLHFTLWLCQNSYGKSPFLMGKSTISMVIFNSYVKLPEGTVPNMNIGFFLGGTVDGCEIRLSPVDSWETSHYL